ncbi:hypothetical protein [Phytohabitans kaempferiae]|uniref:Resolvase/invertase-type recombinase catalytic domain-containing protein n=1 Tax=Phytohabitans kaempferiae TaxID=1620943 RepID=A0ABV6M2V1_9ACTN
MAQLQGQSDVVLGEVGRRSRRGDDVLQRRALQLLLERVMLRKRCGIDVIH